MGSVRADVLPPLLDEHWLLDCFGSLQEEWRRLKSAQLILDLSQLTWIDPMAFLAVIAEIQYGLSLGFLERALLDLGEWGTSELATQRARTLRHLSSNGMLGCFRRSPVQIKYQGAADEAPKTVPANDPEPMATLLRQLETQLGARGPLDSRDSILFAATLITKEQVSEQLDRLIATANTLYFSGSRRRIAARDSTLQRLRSVLTELVGNAFEHAFRDAPTSPHHVITYARARRPEQKSGVDDGHLARAARRNELPGEHLIEGVDATERIELYVMDVGRGISRDIQAWRKGVIEQRKLLPKPRGEGRNKGSARRGGDLHEQLERQELEQLHKALTGAHHDEAILKLLFRYPVSRHEERQRRGQTTGLVYLNKVLGYTSDVSVLYAKRHRLYGRHKFEDQKNVKHELCKHDGKALKGTFYRISLRIHNTTPLPADWFTPETAPLTSREIANSLAQRGPASVIDSIIDKREQIAFSTTRGIYTAFGKPIVLIRLGRAAGKNDIVGMVRDWANSRGGSASTQPLQLLIFTDLSRPQARQLHSALLRDHRGDASTDGGAEPRQSIMLVTEDLAVAVLQVHASKNVTSPRLSSYSLAGADTWSREDPRKGRLVDRISLIARSLRNVDSNDFWHEVVSQTRQDLQLLVGPVKWWISRADSIMLPYYLDFRSSLQDRKLARIVRKSLRRMISLFPTAKFLAMDGMIEGELRDATRWRTPGDVILSEAADGVEQSMASVVDSEIVLVGSVSVSGATLKRFERSLSLPRGFVVNCFDASEAETAVTDATTLSALLWVDQTDVRLPNTLNSKAAPVFERDRDTPYIRRVETQFARQSVIAFGMPDRLNRRQWPSEMYDAFARDGLLRVGHWQYGGRHSVIEANTPLAVDHFIASSRGLIPWLLHSVEEHRKLVAGDDLNFVTWLIVFPDHRSANKLVRALRAELENGQLGWDYVPLQMVAGAAGGISKIADISMARVERIRDFHPESRTCAIFVDIGFIDRNTLRDVRRQLSARGVEVTAALGVMNRSNDPSFADEDSGADLHSYWRWNVPVLGRSAQCTLCSGRQSLGYLSTAMIDRRMDLLDVVDDVIKRWGVAGLQDDWWESGLEPYPLPAPISSRMGHADDTFKDVPSFAQVAAEPNGPYWHVVQHRTSAGLLAHYVELTRYTGNSMLLLERIRERDEVANLPGLVLIELIAGFLACCGSTLSFPQRSAHIEELVKQVFRHEEQVASKAIDAHRQRSAMVLGLAALMTVNLDVRTKRSCLEIIERCLAEYLRNPATSGERNAVPSPESRLILVSLLQHPDGQSALNSESGIRAATLPADRRTREVLESLSLSGLTRIRLWSAYDEKLGRRAEHDGQVRRSIESSERARHGRDASSACFALAALLGATPDYFLRATGLDSFRNENPIAALNKLGRSLLQADPSQVSAELGRARVLLERLRSQFQENLLRCTWNGDNIATTLHSWLRKKGIVRDEEDPFMESPPAAAFVSVDAQWRGTHYLPMCGQLQSTLENVLSNALRHGEKKFVLVETSTFPSNVWIDLKQNSTGVVLSVSNLAKATTEEPAGTAAQFLDDIDGSLRTKRRTWDQDSSQDLYIVEIVIPWLERLHDDPTSEHGEAEKLEANV